MLPAHELGEVGRRRQPARTTLRVETRCISCPEAEQEARDERRKGTSSRGADVCLAGRKRGAYPKRSFWSVLDLVEIRGCPCRGPVAVPARAERPVISPRRDRPPGSWLRHRPQARKNKFRSKVATSKAVVFACHRPQDLICASGGVRSWFSPFQLVQGGRYKTPSIPPSGPLVQSRPVPRASFRNPSLAEACFSRHAAALRGNPTLEWCWTEHRQVRREKTPSLPLHSRRRSIRERRDQAALQGVKETSGLV